VDVTTDRVEVTVPPPGVTEAGLKELERPLGKALVKVNATGLLKGSADAEATEIVNTPVAPAFTVTVDVVTPTVKSDEVAGATTICTVAVAIK